MPWEGGGEGLGLMGWRGWVMTINRSGGLAFKIENKNGGAIFLGLTTNTHQ